MEVRKMSQTDQRLTLLGCPFCTKNRHGVGVVGGKDGYTNTRAFWVVCHDCGLKSPKFKTASRCIAYWNARHNGVDKLKKEALTQRLTRILWEPLKWHN